MSDLQVESNQGTHAGARAGMRSAVSVGIRPHVHKRCLSSAALLQPSAVPLTATVLTGALAAVALAAALTCL
jgi:hypothetical protein